MGKYIDGSGLSHFMGILKGYFVPKTRKVNGHELSADVTITKSDVGLGSTANGAEVNQNAFSNVKVGSTTVAADSKTDTLELAAGSNVTLTPDATNDKVTIAAKDTTYSEATTSSSGLLTWLGPTANGSYLASVKVTSGIVNLDEYSLSASDIPDLPASKITNLQTTLDGKAPLASPALSGTPTAPTAAAGTNTTQIATTAFVTNAVGTATAGALQYKGTATKESDISGQAYKKGWYYVVATDGTYFGKVCEVGDMLIAKQDKTSTPANDWDAIQSNIEVLSNAEIDTLWAAA